MMNDSEILNQIAKAFNNLDYKLFEELISNDILCTDQSTSFDKIGKVNVLNYCRNKFEAIRKSDQPVFAEIGFINTQKSGNVKTVSPLEGRPCIIISRGTKENKIALFLVTINKGEVTQVEFCTNSPHWSQAVGLGIYPE